MKKWFFVLITIYMLPARAETLDQFEFRVVTSTINLEDLNTIVGKINSLRIHMRACEMQKEDRRLPSSCYIAARLKHQLLPKEPPTTSAAELDRICINIAQTTNEIKWIRGDELSPTCQKIAKERLRINNYKLSGGTGFE
jgi:hypothetical protein